MTSLSLSCIGEGNGNPLQCSCLENPRDRGAWWAAVYGVAQSRTRWKRLSSSSSSRSRKGDLLDLAGLPLPHKTSPTPFPSALQPHTVLLSSGPLVPPPEGFALAVHYPRLPFPEASLIHSLRHPICGSHALNFPSLHDESAGSFPLSLTGVTAPESRAPST